LPRTLCRPGIVRPAPRQDYQLTGDMRVLEDLVEMRAYMCPADADDPRGRADLIATRQPRAVLADYGQGRALGAARERSLGGNR
jgi:hypothetical protein